jgi:hypothetical protein
MRVLIACEFSGITRDAFLACGHDAISVDLLETERPGPHYTGDVRDLLYTGEWELMIANPPCTYLAISGARWFAARRIQQREAIEFVRLLMNAPIRRICIENPVSVLSTEIRKPDQIINPWQFGHPEKKRTCLWYKNLVFLTPTNVLPKRRRESVVHKSWETDERKRTTGRSRSYEGIAKAMAQQWGNDDGTQIQPDTSR